MNFFRTLRLSSSFSFRSSKVFCHLEYDHPQHHVKSLQLWCQLQPFIFIHRLDRYHFTRNRVESPSPSHAVHKSTTVAWEIELPLRQERFQGRGIFVPIYDIGLTNSHTIVEIERVDSIRPRRPWWGKLSHHLPGRKPRWRSGFQRDIRDISRWIRCFREGSFRMKAKDQYVHKRH